MCAVFHGVGSERIWDFKDLDKIKNINLIKKRRKFREYVAHNEQVAKDYNGFVFFCATD